MVSASRAWIVEINRAAEKQITKLDRPSQALIIRFLRERIANSADPRSLGKALHGDKSGLWRYRVSDYRLICDIQDARITVLVLEVGHRKDVYR